MNDNNSDKVTVGAKLENNKYTFYKGAKIYGNIGKTNYFEVIELYEEVAKHSLIKCNQVSLSNNTSKITEVDASALHFMATTFGCAKQ